MSFDSTKYDVEINNVGFRIENYIKSETDTFIPRLGVGSQNESEFDLLKSKSLEFTGGMLQREWKDDKAFFGSENLVPIYDDGVLYPIKALSTATDIMGKAAATATIQTKDYLFIAINNFNGPNYTSLKRISKDGTITSITLPAASQTDLNPITSMVIWNNQLWACQGTRLLWMNLSSTSMTALGTLSFRRLIVYQGALYGTGGAAGDMHCTLYKYTGNTTTASRTEVGNVGSKVDDYYGQLFIYNGRIMLTRSDGMWSYDGIRVFAVDTTPNAIDDRNFRFPSVLKGYLYYFMPDGFYRTNGSIVDKLYDVAEVGFPVDVCVGKNRLWIIYTNSEFAGSSRYDQSMGYNYTSSSNINGRIAIFDGKAMFTYARTANDGKPASEDLAGQGENNKSVWFNDKLFVFTYYSKTNLGLYFYCSTAETSQTGTSEWKLITSIFDGDFPMITKSLENLELILGLNASADETITVEYRTDGFSTDTGWLTLGSIKTQSKLKEYIYRSSPSGISFKKIQFRFSGTTDLSYGLKKLIFRYLLTPDFSWQWDFSIDAFGDSLTEPLLLKDNTVSSQPVSTLRETIYAARASGAPIGFVDVDRLDLNGAIDDSVTTLTLNSTELLKSSGFVKIDDEIISYTGKTSTTLTGCERGLLGSVAAAHNDNSAVYPYYRAIVRRIKSEHIELTGLDLDSNEDYAKASRISVTLQEV